MPTHQLLFGIAADALGTQEDIGCLGAAGFHAIETDAAMWQREDWKELCRKAKLRAIVRCGIPSGEVGQAVECARELHALVLIGRCAESGLGGDAGFLEIADANAFAASSGVRLVLELAPELFRKGSEAIAALCATVPDLRFLLNASCFAAEETVTDAWPEAMRIVCDRADSIRGSAARAKETDEGPCATVWREAIRAWKRRSPPGRSMVFIADRQPDMHVSISEAEQLCVAARACWHG